MHGWCADTQTDTLTERCINTRQTSSRTHTHMHTQARIRTLKHTLPEDIATLLRHLDVDDIMG